MSQRFDVNYHMIGEGLIPLITDESGGPWVRTDTSAAGTPIMNYVSDVAGANGVASVGLEATSEVQNVCLSWGDILSLDIDNLKYVEFLARLSVAMGTTAVTTQLAFGLASERNDAIDTIAEAALFRALGATAILVETDDGTVNNDDVATGETLGTTFKRFGIEFSHGTSDVRFYMDDSNGFLARVAATTTFDMSNYTGSLQPYAQVQKAANTDLGAFQIDRFSVAFKEP